MGGSRGGKGKGEEGRGTQGGGSGGEKGVKGRRVGSNGTPGVAGEHRPCGKRVCRVMPLECHPLV